MNRIEKTLADLSARGKKMLSPYITAGDPHPDLTVKLMNQLVASGADILEIGLPFSDPMAEGPVIQAAMERALHYHVGIDDLLRMIEEFRKTNQNTPIIVMGYLNTIEQYGYQAFAKRAQAAGIDGTIIVDLPPEEAEELTPLWDAHGLASIYLCSPTTTDERMALISKHGRGYLYYVSIKGVTGSDDFNLEEVRRLYQYRKTQTNLPLMIGFGIKTPEMAAAVASFSDGVIVGAALVTQIHQAYVAKADPALAAGTFIGAMRQAIDNNG